MEYANLTCPICGEALQRSDRTYACGKKHSFDIARQGYVNLLPVQNKRSKNPGDTRDMVAARKSFLDRGHYQPIADAVCRLLGGSLSGSAPVLLDAGCGEGYYLTALQRQLEEAGREPCCMGVDISKEAVRFAAARNKQALWITASAARLPFRDASVDGVMSMFALTVPEEFRRVLKPGGCFLEVTAGRDHLMALKNLIYSEIIEKQAKPAPGYPGFTSLAQEVLEFPVELTEPQEVQQLLSMTPHFWRITRDGAARAAAATGLRDRAQVELRLYRRD